LLWVGRQPCLLHKSCVLFTEYNTPAEFFLVI
jgi:hypothetical protein